MSLFDELKRRNVIRVAAAYLVVGWLLVEVATTLLPTFGAPDWTTRALVIVVALGFFPAVIFAWVYELTPEGVKKESEVDRDSSIVRATGRKLDLITIAAVVIGIGFLGLSRFVMPPAVDEPDAAATAATTADDASVAVLPFINMSGNPDNEYFSDGLTETLLHMLAQVPQLKVAARTSSFAFKGRQEDIRHIASTLNVAHVLEGSVQRAGDRVRITAQLIRADDGFHVWSENYDRTLEDIFRIQDEIAAQVGVALTRSLLGEVTETAVASISTENIAAYDAYLKALGYKATFSYAGLEQAESELKTALTLDPEFIEAKTELADVYYLQNQTGMLSLEEAWRRSSALLDEVIAERPDDIHAQAVALDIDIDYERRTSNARAAIDAVPALEELVARAPGEVRPRLTLAQTLMTYGQADAANAHFQKLIELDSLNPMLYFNYGESLRDKRRYKESTAVFERSLSLLPNQPNVLYSLGENRRAEGDAVGFVDACRRAIALDPQDSELQSLLALYLIRFGLLEEGDRYLRRAVAIAPSSSTTRRAQLARVFASGDLVASRDMAARMITDDVDNRQGAFWSAVNKYQFVSLSDNTAKDAYEFLEKNIPGIHDAGAIDLPLKIVVAQSSLFRLWNAALPKEQALGKMDAYIDRVESIGFGVDDFPQLYVDAAVAREAYPEAVDLLLDHAFTIPVADFPDWRNELLTDFMAPVMTDPRVQAEVKRYEQDDARVRSDLISYTARNQ
ncbi:MAG TPA: tetratricopeptide repeat protein [Woeseiaceae bacterium]|nr:tetratricopeptide repeat protein [Woeseiaceae bacterium]